MLNPHSDIAFNWQESLVNVESRFFDNEVSIMLGFPGMVRTKYYPEINPYSDYVDLIPKYDTDNYSVSGNFQDYAATYNSAYWSRVRENDRLFREGKAGYSMGDGILRKWGDG